MCSAVCFQYKLEGLASTLLYSTNLSGGIGTAIEKSTAVDPEGTYAYFLTGKKVVRFPVGSCSIYESCSVCMNRTRDPLVCVWCGSKCAHFGECTPSTALDLQRCPIVLEKVSPTKGPSSGGTLLTLEGDNFGSPAHEPDSSIKITVGNKPCALVHWNYTFVQCKTPAGQSDTLVDIVVAVNDTHWDPGKSFDVIDKKVAATKFQYQMSTFSGISPSYGPRAGGTSIALRGTNLDSGASQTVSVGSHPCHIHSVTNVTILCSTSRLKGSHPGGDETHRVTLRIDGQEVPYVSTEGLTGTFSYKPNPVVNKIVPASAPFKGRPKVLVMGKNLDSVTKPVMVTRVTSLDYRHHENISKECVPADDGHSLACPVASLFDSSVIPRDELQNRKDPIWVQVHFQMDGLRLPERAAGMKFAYRPPPKFDPFPPGGLNVRANDPTVLIRVGIIISPAHHAAGTSLETLQQGELWGSPAVATTEIAEEISKEEEKSVEPSVAAGPSSAPGAPSVAQAADIERAHGLLMDQLGLLHEGPDQRSSLMDLLVQTRTRMEDWRAGALDPDYLLLKLHETRLAVARLQKAAVSEPPLPRGWQRHWDSGHGRYFYTQLRTGRSQWEFPTVTAAAAATAATAAAPTVENGSNGVEATDVDPASSAERIVLSVEPVPERLPPTDTGEQRTPERVEGLESARSGGEAVEKCSAPVWNPSAHAQVVAEPVLCVPSEEHWSAGPSVPAEREDLPPAQPSPAVLKKKKTKVSAGLALRKKNIPSLLEKWEKIKEEQQL
ncbi:hypothetical protein ISCGN_010743 [Ixodes scapularis]